MAARILDADGNLRKDIPRRFGRLEIVGVVGKSPSGLKVACKCDCGNETEVFLTNLRKNGHTRSCGCLQQESRGANSTKHGMTETAEFRIWSAMLRRCSNKNCEEYSRYGGRGIVVCDRWKDFAMFFEDMGLRPSSRHGIDRHPDNNGNYEPGNCRWATYTENARNTRRNRVLEFNGESLCVSEWAERLGCRVHFLIARLNRGWSIEKTLTTPPVPRGRRTTGLASKV